jgi:hypothetical protein
MPKTLGVSRIPGAFRAMASMAVNAGLTAGIGIVKLGYIPLTGIVFTGILEPVRFFVYMKNHLNGTRSLPNIIACLV